MKMDNKPPADHKSAAVHCPGNDVRCASMLRSDWWGKAEQVATGTEFSLMGFTKKFTTVPSGIIPPLTSQQPLQLSGSLHGGEKTCFFGRGQRSAAWFEYVSGEYICRMEGGLRELLYRRNEQCNSRMMSNLRLSLLLFFPHPTHWHPIFHRLTVLLNVLTFIIDTRFQATWVSFYNDHNVGGCGAKIVPGCEVAFYIVAHLTYSPFFHL